MILSYQGSVNAWECDENDHLNVRFYVERHAQALRAGLQQIGLTHLADQATPGSALINQHIRFQSESRLAAPLSGYMGVVAAHSTHLDVCTELLHTSTGAPSSTCVHRLALGGDDVFSGPLDALNEYAQPRGIEDKALDYAQLQPHRLADFGFRLIGRGAILDAECDAQGVMLAPSYMGRLSDSMPHLWTVMVQDEAQANEGGAVLEYRLAYQHPLRRGQVFSIHSGLRQVGTKVQTFNHLMFEEGSGSLIMSAQAVGVRMDLQARKALTLSEQRMAHLRTFQLSPMTK